ncbi:LIPS lipase, partial [Atlantisia rogersi]|nr:LIPS lipase [Atlantisia rogersi]
LLGPNLAELEAYVTALGQIRALLCLAQRLLDRNPPGCLFAMEEDEDGLSMEVLREFSTMSNGCFYGRCLGFQVGGGGVWGGWGAGGGGGRRRR